jgi:ribonuclease HI
MIGIEKCIIFTDGATSNNGSKHATGGIGVFFWDDDLGDISESFCNKPVTNNKCEITACIKAVERVIESGKEYDRILICTDSKYMKDCLEKWICGWKKNGWKTAKGKPVKNRELLTKLDGYCQKYPIKFQHVRAHQKEPRNKDSMEHFFWYGNMRADKLACLGKTKRPICLS